MPIGLVNTMGAIECKKIKGNWYAYYIKSKRVKGKPYPIKETKYIGRVSAKYARIDDER